MPARPVRGPHLDPGHAVQPSTAPLSTACGSRRWPTCCSRPSGSARSPEGFSGADRRRIALPATRLARATAGTIRLKLLQLGALVRISVRRVAVQMASGQPWQRDGADRPRRPPRRRRLTTTRTAHSRPHPTRRCPRVAQDAAVRSLASPTPATSARLAEQPGSRSRWPPASPGSATGPSPTPPSSPPQADHDPDSAQSTSPDATLPAGGAGRCCPIPRQPYAPTRPGLPSSPAEVGPPSKLAAVRNAG